MGRTKGKRGRRGPPEPGQARGGGDAHPQEAAAPDAARGGRHGWSARTHLVALAVGILVPPTVGLTLLLWSYTRDELERYQEQALAQAHAITADVDRELDSVILALKVLATSPALSDGDLSSFYAQARDAAEFRGVNVILRDRSGQQLLNTLIPLGDPLPAIDSAAVYGEDKKIFETGQPWVTDLIWGKVMNRLAVAVDVPVVRDGQVVFGLTMSIAPERFVELLTSQLPSPDWMVAIVDRRGRFVARTRDHERFLGEEPIEATRRYLKGQDSVWRGPNRDGVPVLSAITSSRLAEWRIVVAVPEEVAEAPLGSLLNNVLIGAVAMLALSLLAATWWGHRLVGPIRQLAEAATALGRGQTVPAVRSPISEVGRVGEALAAAGDALTDGERRFRDFAEAGSDWFWETDTQHRFVWESANAAGVLGLPSEWSYGKTRLEVAAPGADQVALEAHRRALETHQPFREFEYLRRGPKGDVWLSTSGVPVLDEAGRFTGYRGVGRDISARKAAEEGFQHLAHHDPLTGLPNRVLFRDRLGQALAHAHRHKGRAAVLLLDLDDFKNVNDSMGHPAGDALLRAIGRRLATSIRSGDTLARLGGDEFALVQLGVRGPADVATLAAKLLLALESPFEVDAQEVHIAASVGIALFAEDGTDPDALLKNADLALYRAKGEGRGRFRFFESAMDVEVRSRRELEVELRRALERGEFTLAYQPQLDLRTGRIAGVEALLRWSHPERGPVPPSEFVPAAEASGLIVPLGAWVLRQACLQGAAWRAEGLGLTVAVNLSPVQLKHPDLLDVVDEALALSGLEPERLELEVTEGLLVGTNGGVAERIAGLGARGVCLVIDDFGTGYSSLAYLKRLPARKIKVDRSFVCDIGTDPEDEAVVRAIVGLGHALSKEVVAEGVETEAQLKFLRELGCDAAQGFLLARPWPAAEIRRLLAA